MARNAKKTPLDTYVEKMGEIADKFAPKSVEFTMPKMEVINFDVIKCDKLATLVNNILEVLDGQDIEDIIAASVVVERYVAAQSKGRYQQVTPWRGY